MSSRVGLGVPVPTLLPITGTFAGPFVAYFLLLSGRIVATRVRTHHYIGDKLPAATAATSSSGRQCDDMLTLHTRAFNNFLENVPLAFILLLTAELNGGNRRYLAGAMSALFALRVAHVEFGIYGKDNAALGRPVGYFGSCAVLASLAGYTGYLVKGYWGL